MSRSGKPAAPQGFGRASHRYASRRDPEIALRMRIKELAKARVRYGYRRLHVLLQREGWRANHKKVYRLYCELARPHGRIFQRALGSANGTSSGRRVLEMRNFTRHERDARRFLNQPPEFAAARAGLPLTSGGSCDAAGEWICWNGV